MGLHNTEQQVAFHNCLAKRVGQELTFNQVRKLSFIQNEIRGLLDNRPPTILDVGCGTGKILRWLERENAGSRTCGIDLSPGMLKRARTTDAVSNSQYVLCKGETACFADSSFDVVIEVNTLHHMPDRRKAISEMYRVAKLPGLVVAAETNGLNPIELLRAGMNSRIEWRTVLNLRWLQERAFRSTGLRNVRTCNLIFFPPWNESGLRAKLEPVFEAVPIMRELSGVIITIGEKV